MRTFAVPYRVQNPVVAQDMMNPLLRWARQNPSSTPKYCTTMRAEITTFPAKFLIPQVRLDCPILHSTTSEPFSIYGCLGCFIHSAVVIIRG
jgi:hypothetical protein